MSRLRILMLCLALIVGLLVSHVSQTMAQGNSYIVQPGDTLFSIAMRYGTTPEILMVSNGLSSPTIYIGQTLLVPGAPTGAPPAPVPSSSGTIVVQEGHTLFSIATRHGMTVAQLKALNGLSADYIYIGQVLQLSGNAAPPPAPAPVPAYQPAASGTYIVQPGDTLYSIAVRHGSSVFALKKFNGLVEDHIYVGQVLNVSDNSRASAPPAATPAPVAPAPAPASPSGSYVVQPGDTLFRIALGYHTTVPALKALNGLTSDHIYAGQLLNISGHVEESQPPSPPHVPPPSPPDAPPPPQHEEDHQPRDGKPYMVQVGDTLSLIATRYKTTVSTLMQANRLTSDIILIGQSLVIPGQAEYGEPPRLPDSTGTYYTVQGGETLSKIAAQLGVSLGALAQLNNLRSNNWIYIGQRLLIPKGEQAPAPPPGVVPPAVPDKEYYHIVRPGETLSQIAWQYQSNVDTVVEANHLSNANEIFIGQRLYIAGYQAPIVKSVPLYDEEESIPPGSEPTLTPTVLVTPSTTLTSSPSPSATPTAIPPLVTATVVRAATPPTPTVDPASLPPYVPPASEQAPVVATQPPASQPAAPPVWVAQVFTDECGTEDTRHFTSAVRVNVEGVEDQEVDLFAYPIQESNFIAWGKTGSKPVLGPFGVEFAPLDAGNYAVSVPGVGESPSFYVDGDCIAYINFALGGP